MAEFFHAEITKAIIGAFYDVFHELGHGYSEKIYRRAVAIVLRELGVEVIEERHIKVIFHGTNIGTFYVDLVVNGKVIVESRRPGIWIRGTRLRFSTTSNAREAESACSSTSGEN